MKVENKKNEEKKWMKALSERQSELLNILAELSHGVTAVRIALGLDLLLYIDIFQVVRRLKIGKGCVHQGKQRQ